MINEIHPHRFSNQFTISNQIGDDDFILYFNEDRMLLKVNGEEFGIPRKKDISCIAESASNAFLFSLDDVPCYLIYDCSLPENGQFIFKEMTFFRTLEQPEIAWAGILGFQLMSWHLQNKFCGKCGAKTAQKEDERAMVCTSCGTTVFPKISPAIIVAIVSQEGLLLAHNSNFPNNWHSLIAGYVDIGESLEEAVIREVKEEVGLDVRNIRYYKSQPWPFSGSIMIGFFAEADSNQSIAVDNKEITEAAWYSRGNLPAHPPTISIAGDMIDKFEHGEL